MLEQFLSKSHKYSRSSKAAMSETLIIEETIYEKGRLWLEGGEKSFFLFEQNVKNPSRLWKWANVVFEYCLGSATNCSYSSITFHKGAPSYSFLIEVIKFQNIVFEVLHDKACFPSVGKC